MATYAEYKKECDAEHIAVLTPKEWEREGSLSLNDLRAKWGINAKTRTIINDNGQLKVERVEKKPRVPRGPADPSGRPSTGVTKRVWEIADSLKQPADRTKVIAAATKEGINPSTAATQFSKWLRAKKEVV
jgi:hypothetical protein